MPAPTDSIRRPLDVQWTLPEGSFLAELSLDKHVLRT
jgi:hypothetical protein